ncbi:hypothetical protein [Sphingomonas sp.]|jgi:hypothetical protein|uniref:hypothetical protein n=1 Tax=Sphingomonas sp. TaxID=28214 RepID=UPI002E3411B9|nr:hypothetical protein [Sphingomonas sp.]HEX4695706.1 hypothetical protein [Sphingomonas sp.]
MGADANDVPTTIAGNARVALQKRASRQGSWTKANRAAFLDELASSCNVTRAVAAAKMSSTAAYSLRRRDPVFAAAWAEAIEQGIETLRALLLARAMGTADAELIAANPGEEDRHAVEPAPISDDMRLRTLQICRAIADGRHGSAGWRKPRAITRSSDEVFASLATKLDRVEKRLKRDGKI